MNSLLAAPASATHCVEAISDLLDPRHPPLVLTGAGISVGCGIPTYRDAKGVWLRSDPITHQEFIDQPRQRQRYWGRSAIGWPAVAGAEPSRAHLALAALQRSGRVAHIVTQNVDRLHERAGSTCAVDLHGRLDRVRCLDCASYSDRDQMQTRLLAHNPWLARSPGEARPDGDASLAEEEVERVQVPGCDRCGGTLMPDVVFFGGSIPPERVAQCKRSLAESSALIVIGSSLKVYSGYRFCRWAKADNKPIVLVNPGASRADDMADHRLPLPADEALEALVQHLDGSTDGNHENPEVRP
jgi:NAD-dependent SIR2 family protein deacetylase